MNDVRTFTTQHRNNWILRQTEKDEANLERRDQIQRLLSELDSTIDDYARQLFAIRTDPDFQRAHGHDHTLKAPGVPGLKYGDQIAAIEARYSEAIQHRREFPGQYSAEAED